MPRLSDHCLVRSRLLRAALGSFAAMPSASLAQEAPPAQAPYLDPARPVEERVNDLISRMTLEEKVSQMRDHAAAISRLNIPSYVWWNEAAHGVVGTGYATVFPQVIGLGATWDTRLILDIGEAISTEGRATYHEAIRNDNHDWFYGLTFWAPNINVFRDPRWGRGQETYGEDPFLTGRLAVAFVSGMQGNDRRYLKVVSTPKHFAVHSGPEPLRHQFNVDVAPFDLEDTYLPAFRAAVTDGGAESIMCAYNAVDGVPACVNTMLLQDHLKETWGFDGYIVSDCGAVSDVKTGHEYAPDLMHAAAATLEAGTDLECGWGPNAPYATLTRAVREGLVSEAEIDAALKRLFTARFRLGMFDPPESYAYGRIPYSEKNSQEHRTLALQAARKAMVLLENDGTLPLAPNGGRIAVIGPTAELVQALQGNYNGTPLNPVSPIAGMIDRFGAGNVVYAQGSTLAEGLAIPIARNALRSGDTIGLKGEYFANVDLAGEPVAVRVDPAINFNWDKAVPVPGLEPGNFSVRWTGTLTPPAPGDYRLGARVSARGRPGNRQTVRLYLDGELLADNSELQGRDAATPDTRVHFDDQQPHEIRLEYLSPTNSAGIDLTWQPPAGVLEAEALATAEQADVVVGVLGISPQLEGEEMPVDLPGFNGGDRVDITLPKPQRELLAALKTTNKPLVLVLTSGSALVVDDEDVSAILQAWYPGVEGGTAIAETLAGDNNPAGRLPVTFYASVDQLPPFEDYSMAHRTYRYFTGEPWHGFGYGLSYSDFAYNGLELPTQPVAAGDAVTVDVDVKNVGERAGDEVVELYLTQPKQAHTPIRTLGGFERIHLAPGESRHVTFTLDPRTIGQVNEQGERVIVPGRYQVFVGGAQPGESEGGVTATFEVAGPAMTLPR